MLAAGGMTIALVALLGLLLTIISEQVLIYFFGSTGSYSFKVGKLTKIGTTTLIPVVIVCFSYGTVLPIIFFLFFLLIAIGAIMGLY